MVSGSTSKWPDHQPAKANPWESKHHEYIIYIKENINIMYTYITLYSIMNIEIYIYIWIYNIMYPIIIYIYPYENGLMTIPIWLYNLTFDMNMLAFVKRRQHLEN